MSVSENKSRAMLVVVAGPSCSGKTTVSNLVATRLGATLLHLDKHWINTAERPLVSGHPSREQPHQYNGAALMAEATLLLDKGQHVLAEGFLILAYPETLVRADHTFLITAPHEVLAERRQARTLSGGNIVWKNQNGVTESRVDTGWKVHGRQEWEAWGAPQALVPGVTVMDGTLPPDELADAIMVRVRASDIRARSVQSSRDG